MTQLPHIEIGQYSIAGRKEANEDSYGILFPENELLATKGIAMAIADGMSSCEAPKEASESCVKSFLNDYFGTPASWSAKTSVTRVLTATNRWLYSQGQNEYQSNKGMVSTFSGLILRRGIAEVFHIGDSRISLMRNGKIEPLTRDHKTRISDDKEYLSKAMGINPHAEVDYRKLPVALGDILIFTTDGVHEFIDVRQMEAIINDYPQNLDRAAKLIVNEAFENSSPDNMTCQIVRITHTGEIDEDTHIDNLTRLPFPPQLESGMTFEGHRIIREIYASNRTQIYLAKDNESGQNVVIKTPSVNFEDDTDYLEMFTREEWIGSLISNPHVVKIVKSNRPRKFLYYVVEYVEGQTLREWMNDNPTPDLQEVRDIARQLVRGLRAFHRKEIIHQDIKPENIVIDKDGTVKLIDFGSARVASLEDAGEGGNEPIVGGTKNYSAPEFQLGYKSTNQSDIYSMGVILYEMLTGKLPYIGAFDSIRKLKLQSYVSARAINSNIPFWMDECLKKAVEINAADRYFTMSEMVRDFSRPNRNFNQIEIAPLIERYPNGFWKVLAGVLFTINIILLFLLSR